MRPAKVNDEIDVGTLPKYMSTNVIAKHIGCTSRTINRWLKEHPTLGITVHSATGKHYRVLARDEVEWLHGQIKRFHEPTRKDN